MHTDSNLAPVSAQAPVQVLLQAHERLNGFAREREIPHHCAADKGAHRFYRLLHLQDHRPLFNGILDEPRLDAQEPLHGSRHALCAVEIGPIREELHIHMVLNSPLSYVCTHHGQPAHDRLAGGSNQPLHIFVIKSDNGHGQFLTA